MIIKPKDRKKTESRYTQEFRKEVEKELPYAVVIKLADNYTIGVPDMTITFDGHTSWWELKVARKDSATLKGLGKGIQNMMAQRLALEGICYYIVFWDAPSKKGICIYEPKDVNMQNPLLDVAVGDYLKVIEFIKRCHC